MNETLTHMGRFNIVKIKKSQSSSSSFDNSKHIDEILDSVIYSILHEKSALTSSSSSSSSDNLHINEHTYTHDDAHTHTHAHNDAHTHNGIHIEYVNNLPSKVFISDSSLFNKTYGESIEILNKYDYNNVKFKLNNNEFEEVLKLFENENDLKKKIHEHFGGNVFYMFPACVGYALFKYVNSLIKINEPHELTHIDSETLTSYIKHKLMT